MKLTTASHAMDWTNCITTFCWPKTHSASSVLHILNLTLLDSFQLSWKLQQCGYVEKHDCKRQEIYVFIILFGGTRGYTGKPELSGCPWLSGRAFTSYSLGPKRTYHTAGGGGTSNIVLFVWDKQRFSRSCRLSCRMRYVWCYLMFSSSWPSLAKLGTITV